MRKRIRNPFMYPLLRLHLPTVLLLLGSCSHRGAEIRASTPSPVTSELIAESLVDMVVSDSPIKGDVQSIYRKTGHQPIWITNEGLSAKAKDLVQIIYESEQHGLNSESYLRLSDLNAFDDLTGGQKDQQNRKSTNELARLDVALTTAFLAITRDIVNGQVHPTDADPEWFVPSSLKEKGSPAEQLISVTTGGLREYFESIYPANEEYSSLRRALVTYKNIQAQGGWLTLPHDLRLKLGDKHLQGVPKLRERLWISGDLPEAPEHVEDSEIFDSHLEIVLRGFQARHGLSSNGTLDGETILELNVPVAVRIRQIEVNMERWRWLPRDLGAKYAVVNLADFRFHIVDNQKAVLIMNTVVGKELRHTPSFFSHITAAELNPDWIVPKRIAVEDLLPVLKTSPQTLVEKGFRIYSRDRKEVNPLTIDWGGTTSKSFKFTLIQSAGPTNSLGKIKFFIPNRFGIFLHDTPSRELFERRVRTFSSGCIRLQKPFELGNYLFGEDPEWLKTRSEMASINIKRRFSLKTPLPIYILYWTVWIDENGSINFRPDIYNRNWMLEKLLLHRRSAGTAICKSSFSEAAKPIARELIKILSPRRIPNQQCRRPPWTHQARLVSLRTSSWESISRHTHAR